MVKYNSQDRRQALRIQNLLKKVELLEAENNKLKNTINNLSESLAKAPEDILQYKNSALLPAKDK